MTLSPKNRALYEQERPGLDPDSDQHIFSNKSLSRILDAAREEGRKIGHKEAGPQGNEFPNGYGEHQ